jgi:hypothetical protein
MRRSLTLEAQDDTAVKVGFLIAVTENQFPARTQDETRI